MNGHNLIWIVVDSVRTFRTNCDDRDRLDIMDEFAEESVEFLNAYASAPSSILSGAAMFTGMPSCFVSRHFDAWQFDPRVVISLQNVLEEKGYANYAIHNSKEDREVMRDLIKPVSPRYFPKGVTHGKWWTNRQVNQILEKILNSIPETPAFYMLWYDCRLDPDISDIVKRGLQLFKDSGHYDNSVVVMCSDHGYPDPRTGLSQPSLRQTRHDMVVTDDNIRIPLFIRYPGSAHHKVRDVVGTIDLFPTLLHLLDVECDDDRIKNVKGFDLFDLLKGRKAPWKDRVIRIDTRLRLAPGRVTALRTNRYKYVYYHDEKVESLFDLENDPQEMKDLLTDSSNTYDELQLEFRKKFEELQDELNSFHIHELREAFEINIKKVKRKNMGKIIFVSTAPYIFLNLIVDSFRSIFKEISIDILVSKDDELEENTASLFDRVISVEWLNKKSVSRIIGTGDILRYDTALIITEKSSMGFDDPCIYHIAKIIGKKILMVDYNMKFYSRMLNIWTRPLRRYMHNWIFYKQEPLLIIKDIIYYMALIGNYLLKKKLVDTPDMEKVKKMRDRALLVRTESSPNS